MGNVIVQIEEGEYNNFFKTLQDAEAAIEMSKKLSTAIVVLRDVIELGSSLSTEGGVIHIDSIPLYDYVATYMEIANGQ
jgi:hypothetical protein